MIHHRQMAHHYHHHHCCHLGILFQVKFIFYYLIYLDFILGLSHGNPLSHPGGPLPPSSLEAMHHLARERELMSLMLANNNRFDPMAFALANSFQVCLI
jgi:hypothetical protein